MYWFIEVNPMLGSEKVWLCCLGQYHEPGLVHTSTARAHAGKIIYYM